MSALSEPAQHSPSLAHLQDAISRYARSFTRHRRRRLVEEIESCTKSVAKKLAQNASAEISDRHVRAQVRTGYYNQVVALVRDLSRAQAVRQAQQFQTVVVAGTALVLLGAALVVALTAGT